MKIKNFLVIKNYTITENFFLFNDVQYAKSVYNKMQDILTESAMLYLKNCDQIIVDTLTVRNDQEMFKHHMEVLRKRHINQACNILYCDLDMVFIKPYDIFGKLDKFSMCNGNCGVRYYPYNGIDREMWNIQLNSYKDWDTSLTKDDPNYVWEYEQDVYNLMLDHTLYEKNKKKNSSNTFKQYVHNVWNPYNGAGLIHCNGTNQQFDPIALMENLLYLSKQQRYDEIDILLNKKLYREKYVEIGTVPEDGIVITNIWKNN